MGVEQDLARAVFRGQRGQLRQRYREGQEDQLGALGLVVNATVLWNTRYQDAPLNQLHRGPRGAVQPEFEESLECLLDRHV